MPADRSRAFVPRSSLRSLAYRSLLAFAHAFYKIGNGALFTAAGLLRRDELQAASVEQYGVFNLSDAEVDAGLSPAEDDFYRQYLHAGDRVLLVGSGSGRDLIALRVRGYDVSGLEPAPALVAIAQQHQTRRGVAAPMVSGMIETAELGGLYDAVIFSNGCYSFLQGAAVRIAVLRRVAAHLAAEGRVIVSYHPASNYSRLGRWLTRAAAQISAADWEPEPGDVFASDRRVTDLVRYHHMFAKGEFARECEAAGLTFVADALYDEGLEFAAARLASRPNA